jgi:hypothetical protein
LPPRKSGGFSPLAFDEGLEIADAGGYRARYPPSKGRVWPVTRSKESVSMFHPNLKKAVESSFLVGVSGAI